MPPPRSRILPSSSSLRSSVLSRKHSPSVLRPPALSHHHHHRSPQSTHALCLSTARTRVGIHPNSSHLSLPTFALRPFSTSPPRTSTSPAFTYTLAAAYSDKRHNLDLARNVHYYRPDRIPTGTETRPASGQDAFFIAPVGESSSVAFGVVDGVGGWEESGVDPADFAHSLCEYMADAARRAPYGWEKAGAGKSISNGSSNGNGNSNGSSNSNGSGNGNGGVERVKPVDLLDIGYERVMADESIPAGGCTACIGTLNPSGLLSVANLGDSGYIHLSPFRLNYLSPAQTHRFNTPFQLSKLPPQMLKQVALFGGAKPYSEIPTDSALSTQQLAHGDVLVFATDGVWDNLSAEDALRVVSRVMVKLGAWVSPATSSSATTATSSTTPPNFREILETASIKVPSTSSSGDVDASVQGLAAVIATAVTHEAKVASLDRKRDGPFAREVQRLYPEENWRGGKADDICVAVAVVCQA